MKLLLLLAATLAAADPSSSPRLVFTKSFPGSTPAYMCITVKQSGEMEYKESPDDPQPLHAQLSESDAATLFGLAEKLNYFKSPIESGLNVAKTGKKIFRFEPAEGSPSETAFNYSTDVNAQQLLDHFEQISETERAYIELDRTIHFDKLGVNDALARIESLWLRKQLAGPQQFVPLLTRIAEHGSFMHLVRDRAARLRDEFTHTVPAVSTNGDKPAADSGKP